MLEHEPIVILLTFAIFYYFGSRVLPSQQRVLHCMAIIFWMSLGIYWGIYLGVYSSVAPWFCFVNGLLLCSALADRKLEVWLEPVRQGLLVILCIMALYLDVFTSQERFDLQILVLFSWILLPASLLALDQEGDELRVFEGLWKSIGNQFAGFLILSFGLILLAESQSELGGSVYFAGWGWLGVLLFFLGWIWLSGMWPLQTWLVDEIESQPLSNLLFRFLLHGLVFIWLARLWLTAFPDIHVLPNALLIVGIAGLVWTKLLALMQTNLQRALAYQFQAILSAATIWLALLSQRLLQWDWWYLAVFGLSAYAGLSFLAFHSLSRLAVRLGTAPIQSDLFSSQQLMQVSSQLLAVRLFLDVLPTFMVLAVFPILLTSAYWLAFSGLILACIVAVYATYQCSLRPLLARRV